MSRKEYWRAWRVKHPDYYSAACKRYRAAHPGEHYQRVKKYLADHPAIGKAHARLNWAIRSGKLIRLPCKFCSNPKTQAHHTDYSKPLEVIWLCALHHRKEHTMNQNTNTGSYRGECFTGNPSPDALVRKIEPDHEPEQAQGTDEEAEELRRNELYGGIKEDYL